MSFKYKILLLLSPSLVLFDQWTKHWAVSRMMLGDSVPFVGGFWDWVHVRNTGAAFGMLSGLQDHLRVPFFYLISIVALVALIVIFIRLKPADHFSPFPFALIVGGVLGNGIDRVRFGYVIDFISWHIGDKVLWGMDLVWPAFNVADSAISIAMGLLVIQLFQKEKG